MKTRSFVLFVFVVGLALALEGAAVAQSLQLSGPLEQIFEGGGKSD